ncbi:hypothetical protein [Pseudomonas sp. HY13-MNA-CIBAN-0226]|uniref:hypothetical protein n=1 Tax=Pseudomonas sp. HY13-MNA-CIBAN-0226 TaxID=3140473 RepID=UPI0033205250
MKMDQHTTQTSAALLCNAIGVNTLETNSLCCAAAGTIASPNATAEALIPHEKLREAATLDATLIAQNRPPAQLVEGYKPLLPVQETPQQQAVEVFEIDERAEFGKEFPPPEGLQYCQQRGTYIRPPGASASDMFAREHYAYRAGFAAWTRRAWMHAALFDRQPACRKREGSPFFPCSDRPCAKGVPHA